RKRSIAAGSLASVHGVRSPRRTARRMCAGLLVVMSKDYAFGRRLRRYNPRLSFSIPVGVGFTLHPLHSHMLPNPERAIVAPSKLRDYLLSASHPIGRFKATVFTALGYSQEDWETLRDDLLRIARSGSAVLCEFGTFGQKFEVGGILVGPSGRSGEF